MLRVWLCVNRAAHDEERIDRKMGIAGVAGDAVVREETLGLELRVLTLVQDALQRHRRRDVVGGLEHSAEQNRNVEELLSGAPLDLRDDQVTEIRVGAAEIEMKLHSHL